MYYLVWVTGLRGPEAQLWNADYKPNEEHSFLKKIELTEAEAEWSLNQLARKYPLDPPPELPPAGSMALEVPKMTGTYDDYF